MEPFVHLHVHTEYSLLDGAARIAKLVKTCKEMGMPACAITDHGNMFGAISFFDECKKVGIKPIIGCEFYCTEDLYTKTPKSSTFHLVLLAKNDIGYKNLCKLNSRAFVDGFYKHPRIDKKHLKEHSEGLVCLSACIAGEVPQMILQNRLDDAKDCIKWFKDIFGEDYYLEIQNHGLQEELAVNEKLRMFSKEFNIKLVATNDVHYIYKEDNELQDILMCVQMGKFLDDPNRLKFPCEEFYLKNREQMEKIFPNDINALNATIEIAEKCNFEFVYGHYMIPKFETENGTTPTEFLRNLVEEGIIRRYGHETPEIRARVTKELGLIEKQGFVEYFLTVWNYVNAARKMGVSVGMGRGSGAGSCVAYCVGITGIDPLKYDLLFERFINAERVSAPDFDVDFADERRPDIIKWVENKYGKDRVVKIITFGVMAGKAAIKDVARVLRMPYAEVDKITKAMPDNYKRPYVIKKCFGKHIPKPGDKDYGTKYGVPELIEMYETNDQVRRVVDTAIKLEDTPRNCSTHPCGVIIAPEKAEDMFPLARNGEDITTQYNGVQMEHLGLLKMDFLALRNLTDIEKALIYIKENHDVDIDFSSLGVGDPEVYKYIATGNTTAIFQLESGGFQKFMKELKPTSIEDITAGISLYRPGPMDSIPKYVNNKHHPEQIVYDHPLLEPILNVTYGCIVYQEQVMRIVQDLAGYTLGRADEIRRMMSKKKLEAMRAEKQVFLFGKPAENGKPAVDGAIKRGVPQEVAENIWAQMETFAEYAFNKSHAAAYSFIAYQTAYLKRYYETEFLTAVLNNRITNADEIKNYINYAKSEKIMVLPPDVNKSGTYFVANSGKIRFGLCALKGVGVGVCEKIIEERERNGEYSDLENFLERTCDLGVNKRLLESMIFSGAFDCFGKKRSQLAAVYESASDRVSKDKKNKSAGQFSMFDTLLADDVSIKLKYPELNEIDNFLKLKKEKEVIGIYLSGHPLDNHIDEMRDYTFNSSMIESDISDQEAMQDVGTEDEQDSFNSEYQIQEGTYVKCGGILTDIHKTIPKSSNKQMAILKVEDLYGTFDVVCFNKTYEMFKDELQIDKFLTIEGRFSVRNGMKPSILASKIIFWKESKPESDKRTSEHAKEDAQVPKLYLRFSIEDEYLKNKVIEVLKSYPGNAKTFVQSGKTIFNMNCSVNAKNGCISELKALIGEENIKIK